MTFLARLPQDLAAPAQIYRNVVLADSPVGYWRLNDYTAGSPTNIPTAVDSSGNGNNLPYTPNMQSNTGYPVSGPQNQGNILTNLGNPGGNSVLAGTYAISFNGTASAAFDLTAAWSIEGWYIPSSGWTGGCILSDNYTGVVAFALGFCNGTVGQSGAGNYPFVGSYNGSWQGCYSTTFIGTGGRYYIVGTFDGSNFRLYVNGVLVAGPTSGSPLSGIGNRNVYLGVDNGGSGGTNVKGRVSEVALYGSALPAARVAVHYAAGIYV